MSTNAAEPLACLSCLYHHLLHHGGGDVESSLIWVRPGDKIKNSLPSPLPISLSNDALKMIDTRSCPTTGGGHCWFIGQDHAHWGLSACALQRFRDGSMSAAFSALQTVLGAAHMHARASVTINIKNLGDAIVACKPCLCGYTLRTPRYTGSHSYLSPQ